MFLVQIARAHARAPRIRGDRVLLHGFFECLVQLGATSLLVKAADDRPSLNAFLNHLRIAGKGDRLIHICVRNDVKISLPLVRRGLPASSDGLVRGTVHLRRSLQLHLGLEDGRLVVRNEVRFDRGVAFEE